ncbi:hypothetical protein [Yinghuangia sp. YIM S09857]|uniref:hypothetical protein n=1 Tax=Yinghuangia sp. YIM S09857 TaxID=3436929 RepID=UPI003F52EB38
MTHFTRRVAQSALLIAAAGMAPLLGASGAHADSPLGGISGMNGLSTPDATTVTDQVPGATQTLTGTGKAAGKAVQSGVPAAAEGTSKTTGKAVPATKAVGEGTAAATPPAAAVTPDAATTTPAKAPAKAASAAPAKAAQAAPPAPAAQVNAPVAAPAAPLPGLPGLGGGLPALG